MTTPPAIAAQIIGTITEDGPPPGFTWPGWILSCYGEHFPSCKVPKHGSKIHGDCTCGLSAVIVWLNSGGGAAMETSHAVVAGAIFDFLAFLTTRDQPITLSAHDNAAEAIHVLEEWAKTRRLELFGADVERWQQRLSEPLKK